jgi:hypothetical protein
MRLRCLRHLGLVKGQANCEGAANMKKRAKTLREAREILCDALMAMNHDFQPKQL